MNAVVYLWVLNVINMKNFKVGQEFEVVEIIKNVGSLELVGNSGVVTKKGMFTEVICNNSWHKCDYHNQKVALLLPYEVKPMGKLIITKVKQPTIAISPISNENFTIGRSYKITELHVETPKWGMAFETINNHGEWVFCNEIQSAHINGLDWELK